MDTFQLPTPQPALSQQEDLQRQQHASVAAQGSGQGLPQATQQAQQPNTASGLAVVSGIPITADDIDLIEKQWVSKAKEIVEKTSQDPYLQSKEMNKFKAEYVKKRYNKDVKVT
jgi:hypothetical protein